MIIGLRGIKMLLCFSLMQLLFCLVILFGLYYGCSKMCKLTIFVLFKLRDENSAQPPRFFLCPLFSVVFERSCVCVSVKARRHGGEVSEPREQTGGSADDRRAQRDGG